MDMKKILQAMDGVAAKPVEGSNDMKKFLSVITEGANPHKVTLPVQMAMNHYQSPKEKPVKKESLFKKYFAEAEEQVTAELEEEQAIREQRIKQYARKIADRVLEGKESAREKWTKASAEREKKHTEREAEQAKLPKEKRSGAAIDALEKHLKTNEGRQELTPYEAGEADGLSNEPYENPYSEGSKSYAEFRKGYRAGYAERELDEGFQDFNKVEPYYVCLAGKPVKKFDYYEDARRFHDNWKQKLYREGNKEKADKITLMPILDEAGPAQRNKDQGMIGHGLPWKRYNNPDELAQDISSKILTITNIIKLNNMAHDSTIYRALERYFKKYGYPDNVFNRVATIVFKKLDDEGRRLTTDPRIQEQGVDENLRTENRPDTITVDVPLLIRLLEYAKEDAQTDMDLHNVAEKLIQFSQNGDTLTMDNYDAIVGEQEALPAPTNEDKDPCWKDYKMVGTKKKGSKTVPNCVPKK